MIYLLCGLGELAFGLLLYFVLGFTLFQTLCLVAVLGVILFMIFGDDDDTPGGDGATNTDALLVYPGHQTVASPF